MLTNLDFMWGFLWRAFSGFSLLRCVTCQSIDFAQQENTSSNGSRQLCPNSLRPPRGRSRGYLRGTSSSCLYAFA